MCEPTLIISGIMAAASTGLSIMQQNEQAKQHNAAARAANKANAEAAARAYNIESASQQLRVDEARTTVNQERTANILKGTQAQGAALSAAGSSGVGGGALNAVLAEYARQTGVANAELGQTLRFSGQDAELQRRGSHERTVAETALNKIQKAPKPGLLGIGSSVLSGVNTGLGVYSTLNSVKSIKKPSAKKP